MKIRVLLLDELGGASECEESKERDAFAAHMLYLDLVTEMLKREMMIDKYATETG
jgi:hypothetical protein